MCVCVRVCVWVHVCVCFVGVCVCVCTMGDVLICEPQTQKHQLSSQSRLNFCTQFCVFVGVCVGACVCMCVCVLFLKHNIYSLQNPLPPNIVKNTPTISLSLFSSLLFSSSLSKLLFLTTLRVDISEMTSGICK